GSTLSNNAYGRSSWANFWFYTTSMNPSDPHVQIPTSVQLQAGVDYVIGAQVYNNFDSTLINGRVLNMYYAIGGAFTESQHIAFGTGETVLSGSSIPTTGTYNMRIDIDYRSGVEPPSYFSGCYNYINLTFWIAKKSSLSTSNKTYTFNESYTAGYTVAPKPTRTGYTFASWKLSDGSSYTSNEVGTEKTETYTAQWTANTYNITFDKQGGSGGTSTASATYGSTLPSITLPTRTGFTFGGYYTAINGGGTQYYTASGGKSRTFNNAGHLTLYAKWTAANYNLTINPDGGTYNGSSSNTTVAQPYLTSYGLTNPKLVGSYFAGWSGGHSLITPVFAENEIIDFNGTSTYYDLGRTYMYTDKLFVSVEAYMENWTNFTSGMRLLSCTETGGWNIQPNERGNMQFIAYDSGVGYRVAEAGACSSLASGWHSFVSSFDGAYLRFYIDGVLKATSPKFTSGKISYNTTNSIIVGAEPNSTSVVGNYFNGKMRNVCIANTFVEGESLSNLLPTDEVGLPALHIMSNASATTVTATWQQTWATEPSIPTGDGTEYNPYIIDSAEKLGWIANQTDGVVSLSGVYFKQAANIDLSGKIWMPIGNTTAFAGNYDGGGYSVSGITFYSGEREYVGLFGQTDGANISNIIIAAVENAESTNTENCNYVGSIVGEAKNTSLKKCTNLLQIKGNKIVGGIAGQAINSTIDSCMNMAPTTTKKDENGNDVAVHGIDGTQFVGGIVGLAQAAKIANCYAACSITSSDCHGGIVGRVLSSTKTTITSSMFKGTIAKYGNEFALIAGSVAGEVDIEDCLARNTDTQSNPISSLAFGSGIISIESSLCETNSGKYYYQTDNEFMNWAYNNGKPIPKALSWIGQSSPTLTVEFVEENYTLTYQVAKSTYQTIVENAGLNATPNSGSTTLNGTGTEGTSSHLVKGPTRDWKVGDKIGFRMTLLSDSSSISNWNGWGICFCLGVNGMNDFANFVIGNASSGNSVEQERYNSFMRGETITAEHTLTKNQENELFSIWMYSGSASGNYATFSNTQIKIEMYVILA
ncbi:MAG: InlB B-repeat-containing protein, partial [Clostridia bacterium]|nr:InlB B-repeat-containing protein [Clostridia bacterium]